MNKEFKKSFYMCLLVVLLIISNLIGLKFTHFMDITIGVDFITFPFTFLCTLMIINLGGKKEAYRSILIAGVIQLLITISYTIAVNLGNQSLMPDMANYVNAVFKVDQLKILTSVLAFMVSHTILIYIYETFKNYDKELYGLVIGLLGSMFVNSVIFLTLTLRSYETIFIINMLLSNIIVDIIMLIIIVVLFYILKERHVQVVKVNDVSNEVKDFGIENFVLKEGKDIPKTKNVKKKTVKKNNNYKKSGKSSKKTTSDKNISKEKVKKQNKK